MPVGRVLLRRCHCRDPLRAADATADRTPRWHIACSNASGGTTRKCGCDRASFDATEECMNTIGQRSLVIAGLASLALIAAGCDQQRHPAETAGQKIDRAAETAGEKIDRAGNEAAEKTKVAATKAAGVLDDAALTAKVKAALFAEPGLLAGPSPARCRDCGRDAGRAPGRRQAGRQVLTVVGALGSADRRSGIDAAVGGE